MALVLKTRVGKTTGGSNPSTSAWPGMLVRKPLTYIPGLLYLPKHMLGGSEPKGNNNGKLTF